MAANDSSDSPATATRALQEVLGITQSGKCAKHPNCPVLTDKKITSCRICFSEEKLSGIQQSKSFAAVVQQLQKVKKFDASCNNLDFDELSDSEHRLEGRDVVELLQEPGALEGIMKRLSQVQNWILRKKEKEVSSLQMQIQRLEQRLNDADMTVSEQKQTIRSLRRTIQQDLRIIKTMAVQKERDEAEIEALSAHGSVDGRSPPPRRGTRPISPQKISINSHPNPVASPQTKSIASPAAPSSSSPDKQLQTIPRKPVMSSRMQDALRKAQQRHTMNAAAPYGLSAYTRGSLRSLDVGSIPENDDDRSDVFAAPRRQYWSDDDVQLSMSSHKIFQSFRGGLLDIPKSPPPARHDKLAERKKLHVQLDHGQMQALRMPSMRQITRTNSGETELSALTGIGASPAGKPMASISLEPGSAPMSADSMTSNTHTEIEKIAFEQSSMPTLPFNDDHSNMNTSPIIPSDEVNVGGAADIKNEFLFNVTQAECQDKYGDTGLYTGSVIVTEGLPHGPGTMQYDSGRVYSGDWVSGQWHGKGKLLNPNGDQYEGDFVFDSRHGQGIYTWDNGDVYVGRFVQDKRHGNGKFSFHNGSVYEGEFIDGMFEGFGTYKSDIGYYEGEWKQGRYDGTGELRYAQGGKYTGEFKNSVAHGFGLEVTPDGKKRRGVWEEGQPVEYFQRS